MGECSRMMADILRRADEDPDRIAVTDAGGSVTASELAGRIRGMAGLLASRGAKRGDAVAVDLGRTADHLAARYAALMIGAAAVSLSPAYPESRKRAIIEASGASVVVDEGFVRESRGAAPIVEPLDIPDDAPGYIAFTSGSTGEPKGVVHERSVFPYLMDCYADSGLDATGMRLGALSDFSFIASMVETHLFIAGGSEVVIIGREDAKDPPSLLRVLRERGIDAVLMNPGMYAALWKELDLKLCLLAGEAARRCHVPEGRVVLNVYGSTEALMSFTRVEDMEEPRVDFTAPGCRLWMAEDGEILFSGRGVMKGYIGDHAAPFAVVDGVRAFRTGDLGRRTGDGISVVGRMDRMVKVRGYRVEPAEVERAMESVPGVSEAAAKAFPDGATSYICGYYAGNIPEEEVRSALEAALPEYMVPRAIVRVERFARNENGKIDRTALLEPSASRAPYVAPSDDRERAVCEAFSEVLDTENVGIDDDFIALGGDSIKAMRAVASLRSGNGDMFLWLRTSDVLGLRTPRSIAAKRLSGTVLAELEYDEGFPAPDAVRNGYMTATELDEPHYALLFAIEGDGWDDAERLRTAAEAVVRAFPALRMRLENDGEELWARFDAGSDVEIRDGTPEEVFSGFRRGFDPDGDRLSRLIVCREEGKASVMLYASHMVFDGRSARPLAEAFSRAYKGGTLETDRGMALQSAYDVSARSGPGRIRSEQVMREASAPVRGSKGLPRSQFDGGGTMTYVLSVDDETLRAFARRNGVTATTVAAAAFGLAKAKVEGCTESFCSLVTDGRFVPGTEDSVGMFVRFVPLHVVYDGMPLGEFLKRVEASIGSLLSSTDYPLWQAKAMMYPDEGFSFQYANYVDELEGLGMRYRSMDRGYWFECSALEVHPVDGRNVVALEYAMCYSEKTMVALVEEFDRILQLMMTADTTFSLWDTTA